MKATPATSKPRPYRQGARAEAAEANGRAIVEAFVARLMKQWYDEITLDLVARDAGVTVQTIVRRFGSKEGLLHEAIAVLTEQIETTRAAPAGDIRQNVDGLIRDYEKTGDAVIRLLALEPRHRALSAVLNCGRGQHRAWIGRVVARELEGLEPAVRERAVDAITIVTDVYAWKLLRRDMKRSIPAAAAAVERLIRATVQEFAKESGDRR